MGGDPSLETIIKTWGKWEVYKYGFCNMLKKFPITQSSSFWVVDTNIFLVLSKASLYLLRKYP